MLAVLLTALAAAPAGLAVEKAYTPSPALLQREINGLEGQVARLRVRAANDEFRIGNLEDCEHSLANAWQYPYIDPLGGSK